MAAVGTSPISKKQPLTVGRNLVLAIGNMLVQGFNMADSGIVDQIKATFKS